jgi:hypothetical protein
LGRLYFGPGPSSYIGSLSFPQGQAKMTINVPGISTCIGAWVKSDQPNPNPQPDGGDWLSLAGTTLVASMIALFM